MTPPDPVFVLHGIGNRDPAEFEAIVADLDRATGGRWPLVPIFWGDLGADVSGLPYTVPPARVAAVGALRGPLADPGTALGIAAADADAEGDVEGAEGAADSGWSAAFAAHLFAGALDGGPGVPDAAPAGIQLRGGTADAGFLPAQVVRGVGRAVDEAAETGGIPVRDDPQERQANVVAALARAWPTTTWLRRIEDPQLLTEIGITVTRSLLDGAALDDPDGYELRDGPDLATVVRRRLADLDRLVGAATSAAAGRINAYLRTEFGPNAVRLFGDTLVYQRDRARIHRRVRDRIAEVQAGLGRSPEQAVRVIGHSFGGVIAVDLAVDAEPLWIRSLVTIGSQPALLHVTDPRSPSLAAFRPASGPVRLPPSLRAWTNLWEPMDPLAFLAARVFTLWDGSSPRDVGVPHRASHGVWTHSSYWVMPEFVDVLAAEFG